MKEYKQLIYTNDKKGQAKMNADLNVHARAGWRVAQMTTADAGLNVKKAAAISMLVASQTSDHSFKYGYLGPLLAKRQPDIIVTLEREASGGEQNSDGPDFCTKCGSRLQSDAGFCARCGNEIVHLIGAARSNELESNHGQLGAGSTQEVAHPVSQGATGHVSAPPKRVVFGSGWSGYGQGPEVPLPVSSSWTVSWLAKKAGAAVSSTADLGEEQFEKVMKDNFPTFAKWAGM